MLSSQIQKQSGLISLSKFLRTNSLTLSVYVIPKFFHMARHTKVNLKTVSNCQGSLKAELKKSNRLDIRKKLECGVGLPCLHSNFSVLKLSISLLSIYCYQQKLFPERNRKFVEKYEHFS